MPHYRSLYRAAARAALALEPHFVGVTVLPAWRGNVDADSLPVMGVVTPSEATALSRHNQTERGTLLQVVIKRFGLDDLEDMLDQDSAAIEAAVIPAIWTAQNDVQCKPESVAISLDAHGEKTIGTLIVSFRVASWRPLAAQNP